MRVFASTGEPSGERLAADLIGELRAALGPEPLAVEAIGGPVLAAAGATIVRANRGWAAIGLVDALRRIPPLLVAVVATALRIVRNPPDLVVLVDFGAFNLRLARLIRRLGGRVPILYYVPPSAWLDRPAVARAVAANAEALTPFAHQRDFYRSLGLPIAWCGHPLAAAIAPRAPRPPAPADGGVLALLPGSREGELARHLGLVLDAFIVARTARPALRGRLAAVDADASAALRAAVAAADLAAAVEVVDDARAALAASDAALVASGTAVLEAALVGVPCAAFYRLAPAQARIARRVWRRPYVTLPNLVLDRPAVPELLLDAATPAALAGAALALLADPLPQRAALAPLRERLGPPDALARAARFALEIAGRRA